MSNNYQWEDEYEQGTKLTQEEVDNAAIAFYVLLTLAFGGLIIFGCYLLD